MKTLEDRPPQVIREIIKTGGAPAKAGPPKKKGPTLPPGERKDPKIVTHSVLKTIAAFLNTEGGDLLIGVADDKSVPGITVDAFDSDDRFLLHLSHVVAQGLGDRAGTCIDPRIQIVRGRPVCLVGCQRSPEPVYLSWKGTNESLDGDFFIRSGPGTLKLEPDSARKFISTRFTSG